MARRHKHEEHANHEAWAIPYADLMTLLLAFFVVMYAISTVNEGKYRVMADALTAAFGGAPRTINPVQVGNHQLQGADFDRPSPIKSGAKQGPSAPSPSPNVTLLAAMASQMNMSLDAKGLQSAQGELKRIADDLERALAPLIESHTFVTDMRVMGDKVQKMLHEGLDAFAHGAFVEQVQLLGACQLFFFHEVPLVIG